jgi:hypothetical protein
MGPRPQGRPGERHLSLPSQYNLCTTGDGYERTQVTLSCDKGVVAGNALVGAVARGKLGKQGPSRIKVCVKTNMAAV